MMLIPLRGILARWKALVLVLTPLVLSFIPIVGQSSEARCGYVIMIMAVYWMTQALPLAITALIPVFAFPLLGIISTGDVCLVYMKETNMMFLGGLTVAIAVEHCNLHKRIALFVILHIGQSPRKLMAGFMLTTMFLSMWISNTASTAMMVPIVDAILVELYSTKDGDIETLPKEDNLPPDYTEMECIPGGGSPMQEHTGKRPLLQEGEELKGKGNDTEAVLWKSQLSLSIHEAVGDQVHESQSTYDSRAEERSALYKMFYMGLAYSANVGGTGTLTGTGPNLVVKAQLKSSFSEPTGLNFATWMAFNVPGMLLCVLLAWLWLQVLFMGLFRKKGAIQKSSPESEMAIRRLITEKYNQLGPITYHETTVLILFITLVLLWLFRAPEFIAGWGSWFTAAFGHDLEVDDATPAMLIVFLLFALPSKLNFWCFRNPTDPEPSRPTSCLTWQAVQEKIPWGVVLLLGGGFAMAEAAKKSGLSVWLGSQLQYFEVMPKEAIVFVVCLMTAMLTEVASNTATASILLPVLKELSLNINVNPLYLMLPAAVCCSYAFMLPVATPPNAIVFSAARMNTIDMMRAGIVMNVICVLVMTIMINTLGVALFDLQNMPPWTNSTIT